jgi:hypothetical protein
MTSSLSHPTSICHSRLFQPAYSFQRCCHPFLHFFLHFCGCDNEVSDISLNSKFDLGMPTPGPEPGQPYGAMGGAGQDEQQSCDNQNGGFDGQLECQANDSMARPFPKRIHDRLNVDINPKWADIILIVCFFISGLIDSAAFNTYSCFTSMQTGTYE